MQTADMLRTHPRQSDPSLAGVIDQLVACSQTCTSCADACLGEDHHLTELIRCIRLNLDCADICDTTARVLSRQTEFEPTLARALLSACIEACAACGAECERHAAMGMEHCRVCAEVCRRCEEQCREALDRIAA